MKKNIKGFIGVVNTPPFLVFFFSVAAFILRLLPWKSSIVGFGRDFLFVQPDAYYHLRRATIWANNFPKMPTLDFYMAYPYGAECPWPPLYDWFIAALSVVIGMGTPSKQIIGLVTALLPPVIAALCVLPVYKITKLMFESERIALFSAFFAIVMPGMLGYSHVGSGDHHIAETFLSLWFFYYGILSVKMAVDKAPFKKEAFKAGIFMAMGLLVWQGQVVFFTLYGFYVLWVFFRQKDSRENLFNVAKAVIITGFTAAAITAIARFIVPRGTEQTLWDFGFFSYFQPSYVAFVSISLGICAFFLARGKSGKELLKESTWAMLLIAALAVAAPPVRENIINGVKFLFKTDPWHASINEFQKSFDFSRFWPLSELRQITEILYFISYIFPVVYGVLIIRDFLKNKDTALERSFYFFWGVILGVLGFYQRRWNNAYSPALAIGLALFTNTIYIKIKSGHGLFREFLKWREDHKGERVGLLARLALFSEKSPFMLASIIIICFMLPYYSMAKQLLRTEGYPIPSDLFNSLVWMRKYLPPTSNLWEPDKKPEYGIIAPWDHGHYIQYIAEKPAIVNNFGHQLRGDGFKDAIYIWSTETEDEMVKIFDKYNARFIFAQNVVPYLNNPILKYMKEGFAEKYLSTEQAHFNANITVPQEEYFTLPMARLVEFDGSSSSYGPALRHFRLVFESENLDIMPYHLKDVKVYKLYEYVKGAKVIGKTEPRSIVYFRAHFISNWDREFEWEAAAIADDKGNFTGTLPYATSEDNIFIKPMSSYVITDGIKYIELQVSNQDVLEGKKIALDLSKGKRLPKEVQEMFREKLKSSVGAVKSKSYVNIHKKP